MIEIIDRNDSRAVRNKNNVLALYDLMINKKQSEEATAKFVSPAYIQHNPLIQTVRSRSGSSLPRSPGNASGPASSSTALSLRATMYGRT
jgi:hypothetical protein